MYTPETKAKRMAAATKKVKLFEAKAAEFHRQRAEALAAAAEWQRHWEWLNAMPTTGDAPEPQGEPAQTGSEG